MFDRFLTWLWPVPLSPKAPGHARSDSQGNATVRASPIRTRTRRGKTRFLREIQRTFSPEVYERCRKLTETDGQDAAVDYLWRNVVHKLPL